MRRTMFLAVSICVILSSGVLLPPVRADTGVSLNLIYRPDQGAFPVALSWSEQITQGEWAVTADGLAAFDGWYGVGATIPLSAPGNALANFCGFKWSDSFERILENTQGGAALLTDKPDLKAARVFGYLKWTAYTF